MKPLAIAAIHPRARRSTCGSETRQEHARDQPEHRADRVQQTRCRAADDDRQADDRRRQDEPAAAVRHDLGSFRLRRSVPRVIVFLLPNATTFGAESKAARADWYTSARTGRTRPALVAQRIERLASDQKAGGSSPSEGTKESAY